MSVSPPSRVAPPVLRDSAALEVSAADRLHLLRAHGVRPSVVEPVEAQRNLLAGLTLCTAWRSALRSSSTTSDSSGEPHVRTRSPLAARPMVSSRRPAAGGGASGF